MVVVVVSVSLLASVGLLGMLAEVAYPAGPTIRGGGDSIKRNVNLKNARQQQQQPLIYAVGLVRNMADIQPEVLRWLAEMNCHHAVGLHILAGSGSDTNGGVSDDSEGRATGRGLNHYRSRIVDEQSRIPTEDPAEPAADADTGTNANANANAHKDQEKEFVGCATVHIVSEDVNAIYGDNVSPPTNRIERIAALRDYQRELLRPIYVDKENTNSRSGNGARIDQGAVVIVIDLDLAALPPPQRVLDVTQKLAGSSATDTEDNSNNFPYDAICAAGVTAASRSVRDLWYYDTYATVLWPDTYLHPLNRRLIKRHYAGEDPSLVRSDDRNGNWTQGDIMRYLQTAGERSEDGVVEARSCFGGMAVYRASAWFEPGCRYGADNVRRVGAGSGGDNDDPAAATKSDWLMRYASEVDGRPCEHVVFHDCLVRTADWDGRSNAGRSRIAIMPKLLTLWRKDGKK